MLKQQIQDLMIGFVEELCTEKEIEKFYKKHLKENCLLPIDARILAAIMLSIVVKQGYFLEKIVRDIIDQEEHLELHNFSGDMRTEFMYTMYSRNLIDQYIEKLSKKGSSPTRNEYDSLLEGIQKYEADPTKIIVDTVKRNIDMCFFDKRYKSWYIVEMKFCDNRIGKSYEEIHRKLLNIYSGFLNECEMSEWNNIHPIIYYFNGYQSKKSKFFPKEYIYYDEHFFNDFIKSVSYNDILHCLKEVKESDEMKHAIHGLQEKIRSYVKVQEEKKKELEEKEKEKEI